VTPFAVRRFIIQHSALITTVRLSTLYFPHFYFLAQRAAPAPAVKDSEPAPPKCPKCDSEMILRTAKRGDNKGKQFYGCSRYPKCRQMINVD
jgi:hypothetical protein